jgi:hypothetical protein
MSWTFPLKHRVRMVTMKRCSSDQDLSRLPILNRTNSAPAVLIRPRPTWAAWLSELPWPLPARFRETNNTYKAPKLLSS